MTDNMLTDRQVKVLGIVAEGDDGRWHARWIDITMTSCHGAGQVAVLKGLRTLERRGLVSAQATEVGGQWTVTTKAGNTSEVRDAGDYISHPADASAHGDFTST